MDIITEFNFPVLTVAGLWIGGYVFLVVMTAKALKLVQDNAPLWALGAGVFAGLQYLAIALFPEAQEVVEAIYVTTAGIMTAVLFYAFVYEPIAGKIGLKAHTDEFE